MKINILNPGFMQRLDRYLMYNKPHLWSGRVHYGVYYCLLNIPIIILLTLSVGIAHVGVSLMLSIFPLMLSYLIFTGNILEKAPVITNKFDWPSKINAGFYYIAVCLVISITICLPVILQKIKIIQIINNNDISNLSSKFMFSTGTRSDIENEISTYVLDNMKEEYTNKINSLWAESNLEGKNLHNFERIEEEWKRMRDSLTYDMFFKVWSYDTIYPDNADDTLYVLYSKSIDYYNLKQTINNIYKHDINGIKWSENKSKITSLLQYYYYPLYLLISSILCITLLIFIIAFFQPITKLLTLEIHIDKAFAPPIILFIPIVMFLLFAIEEVMFNSDNGLIISVSRHTYSGLISYAILIYYNWKFNNNFNYQLYRERLYWLPVSVIAMQFILLTGIPLISILSSSFSAIQIIMLLILTLISIPILIKSYHMIEKLPKLS